MKIGWRLLVMLMAAIIISGGIFFFAQKSISPTIHPNSTPTPVPAGNSPVGFVGCSNSRDTVQGYHAIGGTRIWNPPTDNTYGGGTPVRWASGIGNSSSKFWNEFDAMNAKSPGAKTLWLSLCFMSAESDSASYTAAVSVINEINRKIPGLTIYVSALNEFVAPHVCSITGKNGPLRAQMLADRLVAEGRAKTGPYVGELISDDQIPSTGATPQNTETINDGCHPSPQKGEPKLGRELLKFFN